MAIFIPKQKPPCTRRRTCKWCGAWKMKKTMYKLRDGPVDWWFCSDDHALEWLDYRHKSPVINAMLHRLPHKRDLGGKTIEQWVRDEVSHSMEGDA